MNYKNNIFFEKYNNFIKMENESDNVKESNGDKITKLNESEYIEENSPSVSKNKYIFQINNI